MIGRRDKRLMVVDRTATGLSVKQRYLMMGMLSNVKKK